MKKTVALILALFFMLTLFSLAICAQQGNPQTNFPATVMAAKPSLYLNFNDPTTAFTDKISGAAFGYNPPTTVSIPTAFGSPSNNGSTGQVTLLGTALTPGPLQTINLQTRTAPAAGQTVTIVLAAGTSRTALTIVDSFTLTLAATTAEQSFVSGTNFPATTIVANEYIGYWVPSGGGVGVAGGVSGTTNYYLSAASALPAGANSYGSASGGPALQAVIGLPVGTITPRQPGFDSTTPDNTSAAFTYNAWNESPNNTLGAIDWDVPFSLLVHVDRLSWNRTGSLVLMSKGDSSSTSNPYWQLVLQMSGETSQLCFLEGGAGAQGLCTATSADAMPNGFNYDLVVTNGGTGANGVATGTTNAIGLYINGLEVGGVGNYIPAQNVAAYGAGFGSVSLSVSGGTGYASTTAYTSTGGGPNCSVAGTMNASSGVPSSFSTGAAQPNFGCTSAPTIVLTSPTGTGAVITATLATPTMNSTAYPLLVPGYVNGGVTYGVAGTNSAQGPVYVDEAAIFPGVLTPTQIAALYYQTKFYQTLLGARPAVPPAVVEDDDGCGDMDNTWALQEAIALHKLGYINLEGVIQEDIATGNVAYVRQELDQAGLANVPVGIPSDAFTSNACNTTALNTFNATTLGLTNYPTASQVYRQVFAANSGAPVSIMIGSALSGVANFMQSPADSISSLTGAQMFARNAANGGVLFSQGGICTASSPPATTPCTGNIGMQADGTSGYADATYVYANGTAMPMTAVGGTPLPGGPGPLVTRTSKDPTYLQMSLLFGTDTRTAYDSLPMSALVTPYFYGGVSVGYSGGTGYAAETLFTSTGGGANCNVSGYVTASGGVPNGITTLWGEALPIKDESGVVVGLGWGCTSAPTVTLVSPTGTGVTLTAYPTTVCVTPSFSGYPAQSSASSACNNQYQAAMSQWAVPSGAAPVYEWFLNSMVDTPPQRGAPKLK